MSKMNKRLVRIAVPVCAVVMTFAADAYPGSASGFGPGPDGRELITLKKDLTIPGPNAGEGADLALVRAVRVDGEGRIIVLDGRDLKVKVYGTDGRLIRSFGTRGQGPGEFQNVVDMFLKNEVISVFDFGNRRISRFSEDGRHIDDFNLGALDQSRPEAESDAAVYSNKLEWGDNETARLRLVRFDKKTSKLSVIATAKAILSFTKLEPMADQLILRIRRDGVLVWADPCTYELFLDAPDGRRVGRITHSCAKVKVTDEEKAAFIKRVYGEKPTDIELIWPENHSPIASVVLDDGDRVFVETPEKDGQGRRKYDVFDPAGKYLGSFHIGDRIAAVGKGSLYTIGESPDGFPIVERYAMTWGK